MGSFKFNLGDKVRIHSGTEVGEVIGRAEYTYAESSYLLRYISGDGRAIEEWWTASALSAI